MTDLLAHLRREADATLAALQGADWDAPVAACPGWALRDLVQHTGTIHRWALGRALGRPRERDEPDGDEGLAAWFAEGAARLHAGLAAADPDAPCQGFEEPATVGFWVRRQAHETTMHRVDAQWAALGRADAVPADLALDGLAEVAEVFVPRQVALGRMPALTRGLLLEAPEGWVALHGPDPHAVRGSASDLLCALWRRPADVRPDDPDAWRAALAAGLTP